MKKYCSNIKYLLYHNECSAALQVNISKRQLEKVIAFISITCESIDFRFVVSIPTLEDFLERFYGATILDEMDYLMEQYTFIELDTNLCRRKFRGYEKKQKLMSDERLFRKGLYEFCQQLINESEQKYSLLSISEPEKACSFSISPKEDVFDIYYGMTILGDDESYLTSTSTIEEAEEIIKNMFSLRGKYLL